MSLAHPLRLEFRADWRGGEGTIKDPVAMGIKTTGQTKYNMKITKTDRKRLRLYKAKNPLGRYFWTVAEIGELTGGVSRTIVYRSLAKFKGKGQRLDRRVISLSE